MAGDRQNAASYEVLRDYFIVRVFAGKRQGICPERVPFRKEHFSPESLQEHRKTNGVCIFL
jgi:hypothetical protein